MPVELKISYVGLLFAGTDGSKPLREPEATNTLPSARIWADAYHLADASLFPGSFQACPFSAAFEDDLDK